MRMVASLGGFGGFPQPFSKAARHAARLCLGCVGVSASAVRPVQFPESIDGHPAVHLHVRVPAAENGVPGSQQDRAARRILEGGSVREARIAVSCTIATCVFVHACVQFCAPSLWMHVCS